MTDFSTLSDKIREIKISTPVGDSARLLFDKGSYQLIYHAYNSPYLSMTMPPQERQIYTSGAMFPIFEMNIPEGFIRRHISQRLQRYVGTVTDMMFLALQQDSGIGALSYKSEWVLDKPISENLDSLLKWDQPTSVFDYLLSKYLLNTSISGVQPKVMLSADTKSSVLFPNLIAKAGDAGYPQLAENEYLVMSMAKACGLPVPKFYLTENKELFIMERFDLAGDRRLAMEDMCVLMMQSSEKKYIGSYERVAECISLFTQDISQVVMFWRYVMFSCMVGNGDAHLKNFALLSDPFNPDKRWLSPLYDVVNTQIYPTHDNQLALKLNKSKVFPNRDALLKFGRECRVTKPEEELEKMADIINDHLSRAEVWESFQPLRVSLAATLTHAGATNGVFVKLDKKRPKRRKSDHY
jgi:serine/threonine-protein kinase HipA